MRMLFMFETVFSKFWFAFSWIKFSKYEKVLNATVGYSSEFLGAERDEAEIIAVHYESDDQDAVCKMLNGSYISLLYGDN